MAGQESSDLDLLVGIIRSMRDLALFGGFVIVAFNDAMDDMAAPSRSGKPKTGASLFR